MDLLGDRWAMLVVRELMFGPKRFGELRAGLGNISANVLTQRLEGLEVSGIVLRRRLPAPVSAQVYELTAWGYQAEPVLQALGRWAARSPHFDPSKPIGAVSLLLSFRTMLDPARACKSAGRFGFRLGAESFVGVLDADGLTITRGDAESCDVVFAGEPSALAAAVYGGVALARLEAGGQLRIEGNRALAKRFLSCFSLPERAPAAATS